MVHWNRFNRHPFQICIHPFQHSWKGQPSVSAQGYLSRFQHQHTSIGLHLCHCFFQRGGTSFYTHGLASSLEQHSLVGILHREGGGTLPCLSSSSFLWGGTFSSYEVLFFSVFTFVYTICMSYWGGLDYSKHPFSSLFLGEDFSHDIFPLSFLYERLHFIMYMGT